MQSDKSPTTTYNATKPEVNESINESSGETRLMARIISLIVLVVLVLLFGYLFFQVMAGFFVPLFLAVLLAVLFRPLHRWIRRKLQGRVRLAAGLTTLAVLLIVFTPVLLVTLRTITEAREILANHQNLKLDKAMLVRFVDNVNERTGLQMNPEEIQQTIMEWGQRTLGALATRTPGYLGELLLGLAIMALALYYFLADGDQMIIGIGHLLPLEMAHQQRLLDEFGAISRAVASATLLSALAQGLLAGMGYYFAELPSVFLLTMLTILAGMIPFVGAAAVWIPAALWLFFFANSPVAAVLLAVWGGAVVSMVDNLVKPLVLHGQSNLHPLLALLSVLGGVQALGPIGIFVGPMAVVFLQAGLKMLNTEIGSFGKVSLTADEPARKEMLT
jgi:predicted PurR-regulated permease PerM